MKSKPKGNGLNCNRLKGSLLNFKLLLQRPIHALKLLRKLGNSLQTYFVVVVAGAKFLS
jgi:hypothetical protein